MYLYPISIHSFYHSSKFQVIWISNLRVIHLSLQGCLCDLLAFQHVVFLNYVMGGYFLRCYGFKFSYAISFIFTWNPIWFHRPWLSLHWPFKILFPFIVPFNIYLTIEVVCTHWYIFGFHLKWLYSFYVHINYHPFKF